MVAFSKSIFHLYYNVRYADNMKQFQATIFKFQFQVSYKSKLKSTKYI